MEAYIHSKEVKEIQKSCSWAFEIAWCCNWQSIAETQNI
jgi:hypothetical protein